MEATSIALQSGLDAMLEIRSSSRLPLMPQSSPKTLPPISRYVPLQWSRVQPLEECAWSWDVFSTLDRP
jgi:hypothetical protein